MIVSEEAKAREGLVSDVNYETTDCVTDCSMKVHLFVKIIHQE